MMKLEPRPAHPDVTRSMGPMQLAINEAHPELGIVVADARSLGVSWVTIIGLIIQYGPMAINVIRQIIDALRTPVPSVWQSEPGENP